MKSLRFIALFPLFCLSASLPAPVVATCPGTTLDSVNPCDAPGYVYEYWGSGSSSDCSGCSMSYTWTLKDSNGNYVTLGNAHDNAACGAGAARHSIPCPSGGTWVSFALHCGSCQ